MQLGKRGGKKSGPIIRVAVGLLFLLLVIWFHKEIFWVLGFPPGDLSGVVPPSAFVFFNCLVGFMVVFMVWMAIISFQALLPITDLAKNPGLALIEAYRTSFHLFLHMIDQHGPAISVVDGKSNYNEEDARRKERPGVIVIDFNSAVVLEERQPSPGILLIIKRLIYLILEALMLMDASKSPRVCQPGIVFTRPRERIRGVVDLRKQFRLQPKVRCYTRDGIELYANIFTVFTIGQHAEILQVAYEGDMRAENLRVVVLEDKPGGLKRVTGFSDDLDALCSK